MAKWSTLHCSRRRLDDPVENGRNVVTELRRIFAHREMTELLHDDDLGAADACGSAQRIGGRAGEIILAREQEQGAPARVDRGNAPSV